MNSESLFFGGMAGFACGWTVVAVLYVLKVLPAVKRERGMKTLVESSVQLNVAGHIREYGAMAKKENSRSMLRVFYLINVLVVLSVLAFLTAVLATLEL